MRYSGIAVVCIAAVFVLATAGMAQSAEKIAYVNLSRVFDEYGKTQEYDAVLSKKQDQYEQERNVKLQKIQEAQGKLSLLKEAEKTKLQEQIDTDRNALLEFDRQQQTDLRRERDEKIREILLEIEKVVREFAEKGQYSLVLNDKVLIYGAESFEITEPIIKILNEKYSGKK